jgi:hypothetical protein
MKKQKKAKTGSSSSRRASRATPASTSPQVLHMPNDSFIAEPLSESPATSPVSGAPSALASEVVPSGRAEPRSGIRLRGSVRSTPVSAGDPLLAFAAKCQQVYATARSTDASGMTRLDEEYLAQALADAGIGALAEQTLYSLALMASSDGQETLVEDDVLAALQVTAQAS